MYNPHCIACLYVHNIFKRVTWSFYLCRECEEEYGKTANERREHGHEWLNFLINEEAKLRRRLSDADRTRDGKEAYLEDLNMSGFSYEVDYETIVMFRGEYIIDSSDGTFEVRDSDWNPAFSYGV